MLKDKGVAFCAALSTGVLFATILIPSARIISYINDPVSFRGAIMPLIYFIIGIAFITCLKISYCAFVIDDEANKNTFQTPAYLDKTNPKYSPKMAAAIHAWGIVSAKESLKNSPKQELENVLTECAKDYGLSKEGISQCSQVANWNTKGGAPKTP